VIVACCLEPGGDGGIHAVSVDGRGADAEGVHPQAGGASQDGGVGDAPRVSPVPAQCTAADQCRNPAVNCVVFLTVLMDCSAVV
jgi:hypothetical protein